MFTKAKVAIFIDGCFWHGCPEHYRPARANSEFWQSKLLDNRRRDAETNLFLAKAGWTVLRFWEHEDPQEVARSILTEIIAKS